VAVAFDASRAVTVMLMAVPAVAVPGATTEKCVAGFAGVLTTKEYEAIAPIKGLLPPFVFDITDEES